MEEPLPMPPSRTSSIMNLMKRSYTVNARHDPLLRVPSEGSQYSFLSQDQLLRPSPPPVLRPLPSPKLCHQLSIIRPNSSIHNCCSKLYEKGCQCAKKEDTWANKGPGGGTGASFYRSRLSNRRITRRLVHKNGECNVSHVNVPKQRRKYIRDIFTTLIDVKWRWSLLIFAAGFMSSWTIFAGIYYLIALSHGDFKRASPEWKPCIVNLEPYSFTAVFLFSIESQHTIGYGHRYINNECPEAVFTLCLQSIVGVMIQSFMAGVVFAKLARPKKRAETLIFSKSAVIYMRDSKLCFLFRVGDMRKSHLVEAHLRLQMIKKRVTAEGELLPFHQFDMDVGYDAGLDRIFLVWPITISHVIDETSPLYEYSAEDLLTARFEIVAILEGIVESTGMTTQARTSYLPSEVQWGHRFEKLVTYQRENGEYKIDYARFHNTYAVDTPTCSAKELDDMVARGLQIEAAEQDGVTMGGSESALDGLSESFNPAIVAASLNTVHKIQIGHRGSLPANGQITYSRSEDELEATDDGPSPLAEIPAARPKIIIRSPSGSSIDRKSSVPSNSYLRQPDIF